MANEYTALHGIAAPGTSVYGYQRGAAVSAGVVESWDLIVGEANDPDADVVAGDLPADTPAEVLVPRPDEGANRAAWEGYAIANGVPAGAAAEMAIEDLQAVGTGEALVAAGLMRPADSAPKSEWIQFVLALGADEAWAKAATKADLQAYDVRPGDTVAMAATELTEA